jgi:hypothetical protein
MNKRNETKQHKGRNVHFDTHIYKQSMLTSRTAAIANETNVIRKKINEKER